MHCKLVHSFTRCLITSGIILICSGAVGAQIVMGPASQVIASGGTAVFNCSLACSSSLTPVTWYMTFPSNGRTLAVSPYTQVRTIYDIDVTRSTMDLCSQGGYRVEQLVISRAGVDLNLMPVQCSTLCFDGDCACNSVQVFFSKFAVLLINVPPATSLAANNGGASSTRINIAPSSATSCLTQATTTIQDSFTTTIVDVKYVTVTQMAVQTPIAPALP
ncbi:hypothetical protein EMCRGX_G012008 [Ephydatia muelleri]